MESLFKMAQKYILFTVARHMTLLPAAVNYKSFLYTLTRIVTHTLDLGKKSKHWNGIVITVLKKLQKTYKINIKIDINLMFQKFRTTIKITHWNVVQIFYVLKSKNFTIQIHNTRVA